MSILLTNVLSEFHCPCKSSTAHPRDMYNRWPMTSRNSNTKFHRASDRGDGLNFEMITPEVIMPRPELSMPMAPDAKFDFAAVCRNCVSIYLAMKVQYPIRPITKKELLAEMNNSTRLVKIRFMDVMKSGTDYT